MQRGFGEGIIKSLPQYKAYREWFGVAKNLNQYVYYRGCSLTETSIGFSMGRLVLEDAYKGDIILFQRRAKPANKDYPFEYIAIRMKPAPTNLVPKRITSRAPEYRYG